MQAYGSQELDASALLMIPFKFAGPTDPMMVQTIERIQTELANDALMARTSTRESGGGAKPDEEAFSVCGFWLVENLARMGRLDEARLLLEKLLTYSSPVGLYAEAIGPSGEALGNYPSAFTHLSLITACTRLNRSLDVNRGRR